MNSVIHHIGDLLGETIKSYLPITGGDISNAFLVITSHNRYFLKTNTHIEARAMFEAEKLGLETIYKTNTMAVPKVFYCGYLRQHSFLLLQYVESKAFESKDFQRLGSDLAKLHKESQNYFGFTSDNYIGRLHQSNKQHHCWLDFYINERILPQINLAISKGPLLKNNIPTETKLRVVFKELLNNVRPSLLHGDLWSGNFIIALDGTPFLVDPAVYYGHNEVDIAMSKLFGGFDKSFYNTYQEIYPFDDESKARFDLYQLYYLLVHLNMFGSSYYLSVQNIFKRYF